MVCHTVLQSLSHRSILWEEVRGRLRLVNPKLHACHTLSIQCCWWSVMANGDHLKATFYLDFNALWLVCEICPCTMICSVEV